MVVQVKRNDRSINSKINFDFVFLAAPFDVISQAQKLCRYANSALEHEDIATAVKNCEEVLRLLRPYNN